MKKYNLTQTEFKQIVKQYIEEQQKVLDKLETDSQRELYLQSKKTKNYQWWLKRMSKECEKTNKMGFPLSGLASSRNVN